MNLNVGSFADVDELDFWYMPLLPINYRNNLLFTITLLYPFKKLYSQKLI